MNHRTLRWVGEKIRGDFGTSVTFGVAASLTIERPIGAIPPFQLVVARGGLEELVQRWRRIVGGWAVVANHTFPSISNRGCSFRRAMPFASTATRWSRAAGTCMVSR